MAARPLTVEQSGGKVSPEEENNFGPSAEWNTVAGPTGESLLSGGADADAAGGPLLAKELEPSKVAWEVRTCVLSLDVAHQASEPTGSGGSLQATPFLGRVAGPGDGVVVEAG